MNVVSTHVRLFSAELSGVPTELKLVPNEARQVQSELELGPSRRWDVWSRARYALVFVEQGRFYTHERWYEPTSGADTRADRSG